MRITKYTLRLWIVSQLQKCAGKLNRSNTIELHWNTLFTLWGLFEIWHTQNYEWDGECLCVCACEREREREKERKSVCVYMCVCEWKKGSVVETLKYAEKWFKNRKWLPVCIFGCFSNLRTQTFSFNKMRIQTWLILGKWLSSFSTTTMVSLLF